MYDPDYTYELTTDNVKKMLAIYMRFRLVIIHCQMYGCINFVTLIMNMVVFHADNLKRGLSC